MNQPPGSNGRIRTSPSQWIAGTRPRTLPAAIAPVLVGTSVAAWEGGMLWARACAAMVVALALQVGVNFANDYSDGIRGTDSARIGPVRLVGQGLAEPNAVKRAAFAAFTVAGLTGLVLVAVSGIWWLLAVGALALGAAWTYTGGPRPYGYVGLGELSVFVFFGIVAVCGTVIVQVNQVSALAWMCGVGVGALSCAILVANNLRDIPGDTIAGKVTLAVRLGDQRTRLLYESLVVASLLVPVTIGVAALLNPTEWPIGAVLGLGTTVWAIDPIRRVRARLKGRDLVAVLGGTGRMLMVYGLTMSLGIAASAATGV